MQIVNNTKIRIYKIITHGEEMILHIKVPVSFKNKYYFDLNKDWGEHVLELKINICKDKILKHRLSAYQEHSKGLGFHSDNCHAVLDESHTECEKCSIMNLLSVSFDPCLKAVSFDYLSGVPYNAV